MINSQMTRKKSTLVPLEGERPRSKTSEPNGSPASLWLEEGLAPSAFQKARAPGTVSEQCPHLPRAPGPPFPGPGRGR